MKITIDIAEQDLNNEIGDFVKGRVKNLIRTDRELQKLIKGTLEVELKRVTANVVKQTITFTRIEQIAKETVRSQVNTMASSVLSNQIIKELKDRIAKIVTGFDWDEILEKKNEEAIRSLFASEISAIIKLTA